MLKGRKEGNSIPFSFTTFPVMKYAVYTQCTASSERLEILSQTRRFHPI